ncbi:MAG: phenylalanine--tRNA ligase subunit beta [candidate division WOR-3 bacterium]|nr:phenylalanine--tRNA ligase subunit beta [candidate division WOR-3 bacterium]
MPVISIATATLTRLIGKSLGRDELVAALEQLGNNVEGTASVTAFRCETCGQLTEVLEQESFNGACEWCGSKTVVDVGSSEVIRISLLPVRPDMFDAAGLARALRGYLGIETGLPVYRMEPSGFKVNVRSGLESIRPFIVAGVVRGLSMDDETVKTVMKMQENLHWALGRNRRRASIGVYDLDTVEPDFEYSAVAPDGVKFIPLFGMPEGMAEATPKEILEKHPKGTGYKHLLQSFARYPLLCDADGKVLSMPPIINSEETKVTPKTRNLFVDVTGPDKNAITKTLAVIAAGLADLGAKIETVQVVYPDGAKETTPDLSPQTMTIDPKAAERVVGAEIPDMVKVLERMRYGTEWKSTDSTDGLGRGADREGGRLVLRIPAYRADIMHEYDVFEDVAIGYGYHNITPKLVPSMTVGSHQPIEELSTTVRRVMTGLGFLEIMTPALTSEKEHFELLGLAVREPRVRLENPISVEQTMAREQLITGLLSTLRVNTTREMPQQIFEAGDCFEPAAEMETGVRTRRRLGVAIAGPRAGFADAKQALDTLARELGLSLRLTVMAKDKSAPFIDGRCGVIFASPVQSGIGNLKSEIQWGVLGEVHPSVLESFGITQPTALFEIDLSLIG